jgi:hypothetical protein
MNKYGPKNINKDEAQKLYDSGLSLRELSKHLKVCLKTVVDLKLKTRSKKDAMKISLEKREGKIFSPEMLEKLSQYAKERNLGGYRPHPNRGQYYKGIWFDSKYETKVAMSLDEHNIRWTRPKEGFVWNDSGNRYYPDFHLTDYDVFLDPKNDYLITKDKMKIEEAEKRNNIKVFVLDKDNLEWNNINASISQWQTNALV